MLRASEQRIAGSVIELLARHRRELGVAANATAAQDCLVIARALVEAEALVATQPRANLNKRIERALLGYLLR